MNKQITIILLSFYFLGCAATVPLTEEEKSYQKVFEFESSKDELFTKSLDWSTSTFTGSHQLVFKKTLLDPGAILETGVQHSDKETGVIMSNGYVEILSFPVLKIKYSCRIDCKEKRARFTFSNFQYWFDAGVNIRDWADIQKGMLTKLHPELDKLIEDYKTKMKSETLDNNW